MTTPARNDEPHARLTESHIRYALLLAALRGRDEAEEGSILVTAAQSPTPSTPPTRPVVVGGRTQRRK
jgi:hypothetical protein